MAQNFLWFENIVVAVLDNRKLIFFFFFYNLIVSLSNITYTYKKRIDKKIYNINYLIC